MSNTNVKVAVIGGGPGGYAAAFLGADLGLNVTLINPEKNPGGVCLYRGCIPSKALLHVSALINESRHAANWGVEFGEPKIDLAKLRAFKEGVITKLTGGLGILAKQRKITYIQGEASFVNSTTLKVKKSAGGEDTLQFDKIIIATGSSPARPGPLAATGANIMDSTGALDLKDIPKTLLVLGGGYIGLELGTVYATLGSKVDVVEMTPGLLPGADRDLIPPLQKRLEKLFNKVMLNTTVTALQDQITNVKVTFKLPGGETEEKTYDKVLVSVGRRPNSKVPGLENTGVKLTERGFIAVNKQLQTDDPSVYAIGDVAGDPMLAHKAAHEGRTAMEHIAGHKVEFAPYAIPAVVFTDPEIAWAGLTQTEAQEKGMDVEVVKFPWGASGRAVTLDRTEGLTKLLIDKKTERVLGGAIVGPGAGDMIAEIVHAIEMAATAYDLGHTIHPHPTLSETIMEASEIFYGTSTDLYRPKRK
ncbi:MAG: dihydrolipoyl dehydrogenase [Acidobacteria bacterium]|nr:MAG: dihydrolipoyl dehydrogenase [Acidobacteriota bacterium]